MTYKIALISLGCSKNLVDSEIIIGLLKENGYQIIADSEEADGIIVNTCGFILPAKEESIQTLLAQAGFKKAGRCRALIAVGCLVEKYRDELSLAMPEVDGFIGTGDINGIICLLDQKLKGEISSHTVLPEDLYRLRFLTTPSHSAYVKIAEGCDNRCAYCLIPQMRGPYRSRPMEEIQAEVRHLASQGVREINLIAQDTTYYGIDLYGSEKLADLLELLSLEDVTWIRLFYCYPGRITPRLLEVIASKDNICKYLDIPIQHAASSVLKRMGRRENGEALRSLMKMIREKVPGIALRTTCMVGFPGETEEEFAALLDFLTEIKFDWLGAFTYSQEEDTAAAGFPDQVPEEIKKSRYHRLMSLQGEISYQQKKLWVGKTISVLIEGKSKDNPEYFIGRSQFHAPEVDGLVLVKAGDLKIGDFISARIVDADTYDVIGEIETK